MNREQGPFLADGGLVRGAYRIQRMADGRPRAARAAGAESKEELYAGQNTGRVARHTRLSGRKHICDDGKTLHVAGHPAA